MNGQDLFSEKAIGENQPPQSILFRKDANDHWSTFNLGIDSLPVRDTGLVLIFGMHTQHPLHL